MIGTQNFNVRFLLVYGSATGQAQAIAEEIAEKAASFGLKADLHSLEETGKGFNLESETCAVIITSTTGDGNPPANAEKFVRRIKRKTLSHDYLQHLNYAILGLGDTNYSNFCRCAKDIDARLEELGAERFYPTGHADDGVGLEVVAEPWLEGLYPALQKVLGINKTMETSLTEIVHSLTLTENKESNLFPNINKNNIDLQTNINVDSNTSVSSDNACSCSDRNLPEAKSISFSDTDLDFKKDGPHSGTEISSSSEPFDLPSLQKNGDIKQFLNEEGHWSKDILLNNTKPVNNEWEETPCMTVSFTKELEDLPPLLTTPQTSLMEKDLTIPLLPPPFLGLTFSYDIFETSSLSYQNGCKLPCAASEIFSVVISSAKVLTTKDSFKKTLLLQLNTENSIFEFRPGDSISIICANNSSEVSLLLERLKVSKFADQTVTLAVLPDTQKRRAAVPPHMHAMSTLRHIFTTCLSIRETPSKALIRSLIEYTTNPYEIRRMQELCSKEGAAEYTDHVRGCQLSVLDFLFAFPSCQPPVERLLEHLPRLQPRPYSICSCPQSSPNTLDIVFNVVEIPADLNRGHYYHRRGICTGWLDDVTSKLQYGENAGQIKLPIFLRTNQHFRPPEDLSHPIIMIGPGTGVAPFIGFLKQRSAQRKLLPSDNAYGTTLLFFGCRNKDKDFIFRGELEQFEREGTLTKLCVTFSRDPPLTKSEPTVRYVQDKMHLMSAELCHLLVDQEAWVYVCGDARNMAKDVNEALMDILQTETEMSKDDAHLFIMKKRIHKTYFEDVWV